MPQVPLTLVAGATGHPAALHPGSALPYTGTRSNLMGVGEIQDILGSGAVSTQEAINSPLTHTSTLITIH